MRYFKLEANKTDWGLFDEVYDELEKLWDLLQNEDIGPKNAAVQLAFILDKFSNFQQGAEE
jgi:hypothetical protein